MTLHSAFYDARTTAVAVVRLHSCHLVALAIMMQGINARMLSTAQVGDVITHFDVEWGK